MPPLLFLLADTNNQTYLDGGLKAHEGVIPFRANALAFLEVVKRRTEMGARGAGRNGIHGEYRRDFTEIKKMITQPVAWV